MNIAFFEEPVLPGYIYPCSLADIRSRLSRQPEADLEGLAAVGLVPVTRKTATAYARYFAKPKPTIHVCAFTETLSYKQPANTKKADMEHGLGDALRYGMTVEQQGSRWICHWTYETLRCFILDHVLLHEVGHHVYCRQQERAGYENKTSLHVREQFAEDYALRHQELR